jgi:hypothetical protein
VASEYTQKLHYLLNGAKGTNTGKVMYGSKNASKTCRVENNLEKTYSISYHSSYISRVDEKVADNHGLKNQCTKQKSSDKFTESEKRPEQLHEEILDKESLREQ